MNKTTTVSSPTRAGLRGRNLHLGQAVAVKRGPLTGIRGVLLGLRGDGRWMIELDAVQGGVLLIIEPAAVKNRRKVPSKSTSERQ